LSAAKDRDEENVEVLNRGRDLAVVRVAGWREPGFVISGETLRHLSKLADAIVAALHEDHDRDLRDAADELAELLDNQLSIFDSIALDAKDQSTKS